MTFTEVLVGFVAFLLAAGFMLRQKRPKNFPPGPRGIPLFGNGLELGYSAHKNSALMTKKYGDILGITTGSYRTVFLHDPDDIREAFSRAEFTGKYGFNGMTDQNHGHDNAGLIFSEDRVWVDHRRFSLKTLRDFGLGKRSMESVIMTEVGELIESFKATKGAPMSTSHTFNAPIFNIIWSMVASQRYSHNDPELKKLIKWLHDFMDSIFKGFRKLFFLFPLLVDLKNKFPFLFPKSAADKFRVGLFSFFRKTINEHRETMEIGNPRDYIDAYLEEAQKTDDPNSTFKNDDDDNALMITLLDLFIAGADTTSTTLVWCCFLLAKFPEVQEKMYKEIRNVVGSRPVTLEDRPSLPFFEATLAEITRISALALIGVPHATTEDVIFKGYSIPKHTIVLSNLYAVHKSEKIWGDPDNFRPERFLSSDGKTFIRNKNVMPFGFGKRQCLGETLARAELHLFLTNLVLNFKVVMPDDEPPHSIEGQLGGLLTPEPHRVRFLDRNL